MGTGCFEVPLGIEQCLACQLPEAPVFVALVLCLGQVCGPQSLAGFSGEGQAEPVPLQGTRTLPHTFSSHSQPGLLAAAAPRLPRGAGERSAQRVGSASCPLWAVPTVTPQNRQRTAVHWFSLSEHQSPYPGLSKTETGQELEQLGVLVDTVKWPRRFSLRKKGLNEASEGRGEAPPSS